LTIFTPEPVTTNRMTRMTTISRRVGIWARPPCLAI
jgi:hypothetical protein